MENATILIVDDEDAIVQMVKRVLTKEGFSEVLTASSAEEALDIVKKDTVHLILLDEDDKIPITKDLFGILSTIWTDIGQMSVFLFHDFVK
ncbi:response regulator [Bacillus licheniformis]|nr:response regulator [Bacillus licheniformis]